MATPTHTFITGTTVTSEVNSITWSGLPQNYKDLIIVMEGSAPLGGSTYYPRLRFNGSSGQYYSLEMRGGNGYAVTYPYSSGWYQFPINWAAGKKTTVNATILSYSDGGMLGQQKTILVRNDSGQHSSGTGIGRWNFSDAITSIQLLGADAAPMAIGTTINFYGVIA